MSDLTFLEKTTLETVPGSSKESHGNLPQRSKAGSGPEKLRLIKEAADEGCIPAMYDYGLDTVNPTEKRRYLKLAADEGYIPAMYEYGSETVDPAEKRR